MAWSPRKQTTPTRSLRSEPCGCTCTYTSLQRLWETTMNRSIIFRSLASVAVLTLVAVGLEPAGAAQPQARSLSRVIPQARSMPASRRGTVVALPRAQRTGALAKARHHVRLPVRTLRTDGVSTRAHNHVHGSVARHLGRGAAVAIHPGHARVTRVHYTAPRLAPTLAPAAAPTESPATATVAAPSLTQVQVAAEPTEASEAAEPAEAPQAEAAEPTDAPEAAEPAEAPQANVAEPTEVPQADVAEPTDAPEAAEPAEAQQADAAEPTEAPQADAAEPTDAPEATQPTEVPEPTDSPGD